MTVQVRSVWNYNLEVEFEAIRQIVRYCPYVSIDTEFPGILYEYEWPIHPHDLFPDERYYVIKSNVNHLKLIQLGLTLSTSDRDDGIVFIWEFNFRGFNPLQDKHAASSIQFLESQGHNLWMNYHHGVDPQRFADLMWSSGLLCNQSKTWIGFHMAYDIAYLIKILIGTRLPDALESFLELVQWYFGFMVFDIKHLCKSCNISGGLETVAGTMNVQRIAGLAHHAGSDSLLTWETFRRMKASFFHGSIEARHAGILFGLQDS
jgi:CCR4-NOT transcription complex subunit 7/8